MVNTIEELKDLLLSVYFPEINKKLFYTQKHGENSIIVCHNFNETAREVDVSSLSTKILDSINTTKKIQTPTRPT